MILTKLINPKKLNFAAFTLIELMIATAVFSVILLIASIGLIQVGKTYTKGITENQTQDVTRAIIDDISQAVQFGGSSPTSPTGSSIAGSNDMYFCVGDKRYIYATSTEFFDNIATSHGFVRDNLGSGCPNPGSWPAGATDLLGQRMRVANFTLNKLGPTNLYEIKIRVVYGDDDLLCSPSFAGDCSLNSTSTHLTATDLTCKGKAGSQFCAVSELSTVVQKRL